MIKKLKPIILTGEMVSALYNEEVVKGYEGWSIEVDKDTGDYDGEKGALMDYHISLFDNNGEFYGLAIGGYYTGGTGHRFDEDELEFSPPEPETPLSKLNDFLDDLVHENLTLKNKVNKIKKYIDNL